MGDFSLSARSRPSVSSFSKGTRTVSPDELPKPAKIGGILRDFYLSNGGDPAKCTTNEEEAEKKRQRAEYARRSKKKSVTLTVGTVEAIDAEVERLERLGLRALASRDKVVDAALATLRGKT